MHPKNEILLHTPDCPMFPLPQIVFFPGTVLPLHIFEPRYRAMIQDVRRENLPIIMGNLRAERRLDPLGRPEVASVAGIGTMKSCEELPDGRFLIELSGVSRVRILSEHGQEKLYRRVSFELLECHSSDLKAEEKDTETAQLIVASLRNANEKVADFLAQLIRKASDGSELSDSLASAIIADPLERQSLLEELDTSARMHRVVSRLAELLTISAKSDGSPAN